ncbi:hypothetical protein BpHYR1_025994, partial [Brachionus plicatilis]
VNKLWNYREPLLYHHALEFLIFCFCFLYQISQCLAIKLRCQYFLYYFKLYFEKRNIKEISGIANLLI